MKEKHYPVDKACEILHVSRAAYYKWASGKISRRTAQNEELAGIIERIHNESPDKGYRRIRDDLERHLLMQHRQVLPLSCFLKRACPAISLFFARSNITIIEG